MSNRPPIPRLSDPYWYEKELESLRVEIERLRAMTMANVHPEQATIEALKNRISDGDR